MFVAWSIGDNNQIKLFLFCLYIYLLFKLLPNKTLNLGYHLSEIKCFFFNLKPSSIYCFTNYCDNMIIVIKLWLLQVIQS